MKPYVTDESGVPIPLPPGVDPLKFATYHKIILNKKISHREAAMQLQDASDTKWADMTLEQRERATEGMTSLRENLWEHRRKTFGI